VTYSVTHLSDLESIPVGEHGLRWRPIRSRLGIQAFGVNAYTSAQVGGEVVEEHTEETYGHEELYFVVSGRARFTLDGEEVDAPAGTIVHLPEPSVRRSAVALAPETTVLAVGGKRGEPFRPSAWELFFRAARLPPEEALALVEGAEGYAVESASYQYNLACFRALAGRRDEALAALRSALEQDRERIRAWAEKDEDFDSLRDDPEFVALLRKG
jgi:quercetin dioxygenase-like cupin family protein